MIWVCRAGVDSVYVDYYLKSRKIFLPWEGFKTDLRQYTNREALKILVRQEKGDAARTSISNWAGQLYTFCWEMNTGDEVLIPHKGSRKYTFARIDGDYAYLDQNENSLWHSRDISIIEDDIPRDIFSQSMRYSLGAYRTVFKVRDAEDLRTTIKNYTRRK